MDAFEERFTRIGRALYSLHTVLTERFDALPLPIELPPLEDSPESHMAALDSLEGSLDLLREMPLEESQRYLLCAAIVEWGTLYELIGSLQELGYTKFRIVCAEVSASRTATFLKQLEERDETIPPKTA